MPEIVVITGTTTAVGKTWLAARLAEGLVESGIAVAARKPVESFSPEEPTTDSEILAGATGETRDLVCPPQRRYPLAMAPVMAAEALKLPGFSIAELVSETALPRGGVVLVEGAGGVRSPLADDGDVLALGDRLGADRYVLVGDAGLGTINAVRTSAAAIGDRPTIVFLNRFDGSNDVHRRNLAWLRDRDGLDVVASVEAVRRRVAGAAPATLRPSEPTMEAR